MENRAYCSAVKKPAIPNVLLEQRKINTNLHTCTLLGTRIFAFSQIYQGICIKMGFTSFFCEENNVNIASSVSVWLLLWLAVCSPSPAYSCPRLCVCYPSLMMVSCQSQNFSAVPVGIPYDSQRVFLQNNRITELRAQSFGFQTQVGCRRQIENVWGVLWLYSNNISSIKPDSFSDMRDLEELDLGDNPSLRTLHPDSFRGLDKLQSLHIYRCQLGTLPGNIFKKLYSLQFLYLQDNLLQHIQVNRKAFMDLGHLTTLFLFNNALTDLPASALSDLSSLQFLRLNGNPWSCSCQARPLWEWFRQVRISSSELLCAGPEERKGLDLRFLREIDFAPCPMLPYYPRARTTYTFSTRTRWWFPKSGKASGGNSDKSKGLDGKKGQQQDNSYISPDKSQTKSYKAESALPKVKEQDYWEKYENEDSTIRCYELDCLKEANGKSRGVCPDASLFLLSLSLTLTLSLSLTLHFLFPETM
ncbi:UNVERIFIED_CONTAM: hypothetical protein FKN15_072592 [Acipenser sinensis]